MRKTCREGILTLILMSLFLFGCQVERAESLSTITSLLNDFSLKLSILEKRIEYLESKNLPTINDSSCVMFTRDSDTHAIVSATIPITGTYYVTSWDWSLAKIETYRAGTVIPRAQSIIRDTCPQFESFSKRAKK